VSKSKNEHRWSIQTWVCVRAVKTLHQSLLFPQLYKYGATTFLHQMLRLTKWDLRTSYLLSTTCPQCIYGICLEEVCSRQQSRFLDYMPFWYYESQRRREHHNTIKGKKAIWSGYILRRNCLLKHVTEGKIEG